MVADTQHAERSAESGLPTSRIMIPENGYRVGAQSILSLTANGSNDARSGTAEGEMLFSVRSAVQAFVHCYFRSSTGRVFRVLPGSSSPATLFAPGQSVTLAVRKESRTLLGSAGSTVEAESLLCLASAENLEGRLPSSLTTHNPTGLPEHDFDRLYALYRQATRANLVGLTLTLDES